MSALPATASDAHRLARPQGLVPTVVHALVARIVRGEFEPGAELPKEAEVVAQYGVSRTVIREALRVLEEKDLISIQQGKPTRVRGRESWNLLDPMVIGAMVDQDSELDIVTQLVRLRAALEADMAAVAASENSSDFADTLDKHLLEMLSSVDDDLERYFILDRGFHDAIMVAAGQQFSRHIVRQVHVWTHGTTPIAYPRAAIEMSHQEHRGIRDAILAGDPELSRSRMFDHILGSWSRKVGGH